MTCSDAVINAALCGVTRLLRDVIKGVCTQVLQSKESPRTEERGTSGTRGLQWNLCGSHRESETPRHWWSVLTSVYGSFLVSSLHSEQRVDQQYGPEIVQLVIGSNRTV